MNRAENEIQGFQSRREEFANVFTHGVAIFVSLGAVVVLVYMAILSRDFYRIVSTIIFGVTLVLLYLTSTFYHATKSSCLRARFRLIDHCSIYLLIAGSYTPFTLVGIRGGWGWSFFCVVWGLAVAGIIFKLFFVGRFRLLSTGIYVGMGWLALFGIVPIIRNLSISTLFWLVAGGVIYTVGTLFYHNHRIPYAHAIWHLFVVFGSMCHVIAVGTQL